MCRPRRRLSFQGTGEGRGLGAPLGHTTLLFKNASAAECNAAGFPGGCICFIGGHAPPPKNDHHNPTKRGLGESPISENFQVPLKGLSNSLFGYDSF